MKSLAALTGAAALLLGGGGSSPGEIVQSATVASGQRGFEVGTLPGLGRFTAGCRRGSATVTFRAERQTETVAVRSRTVTLDPRRRFTVRLHGVSVWQISGISEGGIIVGDATMSAARMAGSSQCFVTVRADVAERAR